jgi:hypothetical protein
LVGNNKELRCDEETIRALARTKQQPVTTTEGRVMAEKIGAVEYFECSAMLNEGVNEVFQTAAYVVCKYLLLLRVFCSTGVLWNALPC